MAQRERERGDRERERTEKDRLIARQKIREKISGREQMRKIERQGKTDLEKKPHFE